MDLREILERVAAGVMAPSEAARLIRVDLVEQVEGFAKIDVSREARKGIPEILLAEGKRPAQIAKIASRFLDKSGRVVISRVDERERRAVVRALPRAKATWHPEPRILILDTLPGRHPAAQRGRVGIVTAGTSDVPVAEEARVILEEMGCETFCHYDCGVAGIQRLFTALKSLLENDVDAMIAVAGREGAMPTVLAGLVDVPVIGVPTSNGYGLGGDGTAALQAMLQACSLGLAVVNVDSGLAAGVVAGLIARRAAAGGGLEAGSSAERGRGRAPRVHRHREPTPGHASRRRPA